jgi:hypothetical protein
VQAIKLIDGTPGSIEHITGTTADGLLVNLGANNDVTLASEKVVDSAVEASAKGVLIIGKLASGEGDTYRAINVDSSGNVKVDFSAASVGSVPVSGSTIALTNNGSTAIGYISGASENVGDGGVPMLANYDTGEGDAYINPRADSSGYLFVNANAGTNLNTSALALETGGNLAAAATSLAALDNAVSGNELQVDVVTLPTITEPKSTTATTSQVADNSASVTILASNASRLGATILNDSSAALYLRLGSSAATTTNYTVRITQYGYYEVPFRYTGAITGIWASDPGDGAARVTELT